jgi:hypothetical protein
MIDDKKIRKLYILIGCSYLISFGIKTIAKVVIYCLRLNQ